MGIRIQWFMSSDSPTTADDMDSAKEYIRHKRGEGIFYKEIVPGETLGFMEKGLEPVCRLTLLPHTGDGCSAEPSPGNRGQIKGHFKGVEALAKAVREMYPADSWRPGVLVSYLGEEEGWYAAIHRYPSPPQRAVVVAVKGPSLDGVLRELSKNWLQSIGRGQSINELEKSL